MVGPGRLTKGAGVITDFENLPASTFGGYLALSDATPEAEAWLLNAINQLRTHGVGVPALTRDELWQGIFDSVNSAREFSGHEPIDPSDVDARRSNIAGLLTLFTRVFGFAFCPRDGES